MSTDIVTRPVTVDGLSSAEAAERLRLDGPNAAEAPPRRHLTVRVLRQLTDPLVALLLAAAVVTTVLRDYPDTAVILLVVAVNTVIGVVQEVRAERAIAALDQLAAPTARVVRDGQDLVLPGVALGAEPAEPGTLRRVPRSPQESVLGAGLGRHILIAGALISAVTLGAGVLAAHWDRPWQSVVFVVLGLAQLGVALAVRAPRPPGGRRGNPALPLAVAISALLQVAGVLVAPLRDLLGTEALGAVELLACAAVSVLPGLLLRLTMVIRRRKAGSVNLTSPDGSGW